MTHPRGGVRACVAAIGVAVLMVLAACGGPTDAAEPPATTPVSGASGPPARAASGSRSPGAPTHPPDAWTGPPPKRPWNIAVDDKYGAEATARYYVELLGYAWSTGDTSELEELSLGDCDSCAIFMREVLSLYGDGGWESGVRYVIRQSQLVDDKDRKGRIIVLVRSHTPESVRWDPVGQKVRRISEVAQVIEVQLRYSNPDGWQVSASGGERIEK